MGINSIKNSGGFPLVQTSELEGAEWANRGTEKAWSKEKRNLDIGTLSLFP